jgi:hypothetical protein
MEIEERNQFLQEMTALGKTREYKPIIMAEISQVCSYKPFKYLSFIKPISDYISITRCP